MTTADFAVVAANARCPVQVRSMTVGGLVATLRFYRRAAVYLAGDPCGTCRSVTGGTVMARVKKADFSVNHPNGSRTSR